MNLNLIFIKILKTILYAATTITFFVIYNKIVIFCNMETKIDFLYHKITFGNSIYI